MNSQICLYAPASVALLIAGVATGQTIFVTTSADVIDFGGAQQVADLPGPDGKVSLAEAGLASDNTPGLQTIGFQVPPNEWQMQWLYPGRVVLQPFLGFRIFEPAILDATTQTAFSGETNPDGGGEVVIWSGAYLVDNVGSLMRGFDHTAISVSGGSANLIQGNTEVGIEVYDSPFTEVGGVNPGEGNTAGTIKIDRSHDNIVVGNRATRVRVLGWIAGGQPAENVRVGGPSLAERNYITGYGTWNSEGCPGGTTLQIFDSIGIVVENNWIGTTPDGLSQGNLASTAGVGFEGENYDATIKDNRIAGILGHGMGPHCAGFLFGSGIEINGTGDGIVLQGNTIGLNAKGQPVLGSVTGINTVNYYLGPVQHVLIGGSLAGQGNEIAGHLTTGVRVASTYDGVGITGNSIHTNNGLGIDLITTGLLGGPTPNDTLDGDAGGNGLQNFPVLLAAASGPGGTTMSGSLHSAPNQSFRIELFGNSTCDASGFGEGRTPLAAVDVATDGAGNATFQATSPITLEAGSLLTATATRSANGSTSEFSACLPVEMACPGDINGSGAVDGADLAALLGAWGSVGTGNPSDLNGDEVVNAADLALLLGAWGMCG